MTSKRVEVNPGELFMVADRMILVREYDLNGFDLLAKTQREDQS